MIEGSLYNRTCLKWQFSVQERSVNRMKTDSDRGIKKISASEIATERETNSGG